MRHKSENELFSDLDKCLFYVNEMIDFFEVFIDRDEIEFYNEVKRELINLWHNKEK
jgi:hypothetical protein